MNEEKFLPKVEKNPSLPAVLFPDTPEDVPTVPAGKTEQEKEDFATQVEQAAVDRGEVTLRNPLEPPEEAYPGEETLRNRGEL